MDFDSKVFDSKTFDSKVSDSEFFDSKVFDSKVYDYKVFDSKVYEVLYIGSNYKWFNKVYFDTYCLTFWMKLSRRPYLAADKRIFHLQLNWPRW